MLGGGSRLLLLQQPQLRGGKPCLLGCGFATIGLSSGLFSKRVELCGPLLFASLTAAALLGGIALAFFAAAPSFAPSCLAASASERRCSAAF